MSAVRSVSEGMLLTFHRAFDVCNESVEESLETIIALGCDRILTSGRATSVAIGSDVLKMLSKNAKGRISIVAGCGVTSSNAYELVKQTQVQGIHAGSSVTAKKCNALDTASSFKTSAAAAFVSSDMAEWDCVDGSRVASLVDKARRAWAGKAEVEELVLEATDEQEGEDDKFDLLSPVQNRKKEVGGVDTLDSSASAGGGASAGETVPSNLDKSYIYLPGKK